MSRFIHPIFFDYLFISVNSIKKPGIMTENFYLYLKSHFCNHIYTQHTRT